MCTCTSCIRTKCNLSPAISRDEELVLWITPVPLPRSMSPGGTRWLSSSSFNFSDFNRLISSCVKKGIILSLLQHKIQIIYTCKLNGGLQNYMPAHAFNCHSKLFWSSNLLVLQELPILLRDGCYLVFSRFRSIAEVVISLLHPLPLHNVRHTPQYTKCLLTTSHHHKHPRPDTHFFLVTFDRFFKFFNLTPCHLEFSHRVCVQ